MIKIVNVVGARPNFMKIAPIMEAMKARSHVLKPVLAHTGQHYDRNMSSIFFEELGLPTPDIYLKVGSDTHAKQTARIMIEFEKVLLKELPDLVLVVGDVNSTIACALTAAKLHIPVAHIEAGLRSFDRQMPEEINRVLTDAISDYLFVTEKDAQKNLLAEGKKKDSIFFVGNVMIDTLVKNRKKADSSLILSKLKVEAGQYALLTLHRPGNVDDEEKTEKLLQVLRKIAKQIPIVFPMHPRTKLRFKNANWNSEKEFITTDALGYLDFLKLMSGAKMVLTDSGGVQEETTALGIPCLTLRENTERPITVSQGTNKVVGTSGEAIIRESLNLLSGKTRRKKLPELWDGKAAQRIVEILVNLMSNRQKIVKGGYV